MTLEQIEADVWDKACVTKQHVLDFLRLQPTSDSMALKQAVTDWLKKLHNDPHFSKVIFVPEQNAQSLGVSADPITRILDDLDFGPVSQETIIGAPPVPREELQG